jgi:hypothetical protein
LQLRSGTVRNVGPLTLPIVFISSTFR